MVPKSNGPVLSEGQQVLSIDIGVMCKRFNAVNDVKKMMAMAGLPPIPTFPYFF